MLKMINLIECMICLKEDTVARNPKNSLYLVYKVDVVLYNPDNKQSTGEPGSLYYFAKYDDLSLNGDGTLVVDLDNYQTPSRNCYLSSDGYWTGTEFDGYYTLDDLYEDCVLSQTDSCTFENNVAE